MMTGQKLLLTVDETARMLGVGRSYLYDLLMDGRIESVKMGRSRRIPADAVETYVEQMRLEQLGGAN